MDALTDEEIRLQQAKNELTEILAEMLPGGAPAPNPNALTHGITTAIPVIDGMEAREDWQAHLDGTVQSLAPQGHLEHLLARRVATFFWRLNRVIRYETAESLRQVTRIADHNNKMNAIMEPDDDEDVEVEDGWEPISPEDTYREQEYNILPRPLELEKIMRYEAHLHRQALQTLHELEALQARRRGEQTHLARLDISDGPGAYLDAARG